MKENKEKEASVKAKFIIIILIAMIVVLVSLILLLCVKFPDDATDIGNVLVDNIFAIILSICCSVVASVLLMRLTLAQDRLRDEQLVKTISATVSEIYSQNQSLTPKHFFCDTDMPHEKFNEILNEKIRISEMYSFIGDSARFTCERLYGMSQTGNVNPELKIQVILPDFRYDDVYSNKRDFFVTRERKINFHNQRTVENIIHDEKMKTIICLYAIGKMKAFFDVEVYLVKEIPFMRIEIADDFLVLGFTQMQIKGKHYPPVMIYKDEKMFHQSFMAYIKENIERSYKMKEDELTADALVDAARDAGISGVNSKMVCKFYDNGCKSN